MYQVRRRQRVWTGEKYVRPPTNWMSSIDVKIGNQSVYFGDRTLGIGVPPSEFLYSEQVV